MIRVCHLITSLDVGGAQRMLLRLLESTDTERFESSVVTMVPGGALTEGFGRAGFTPESLALRPGSVDPRGILRLRRLLNLAQPDVLQTWLYHADFLGALALRRASGARLVWNLRCSGQADERTRALRRMVTWSCARLSGRPAAVVANSHAGRRYHAGLGYHPRRWVWIPNGFALPAEVPEARSALREELGLPAEAVLGLVLGRWHPSKGIDVLFEALERLSSRGLAVLVAGEGLVKENPRLRAPLARCGGRVRLLGLRRDVPHLLAASDFLISPSRFEGFPNAIGEALAAGRPCVTTDAGDSAVVVGEAGFVVPCADAPALAAAVERMAALTGDERAALGRAGRARIAAEYSLASVAKRYAELYADLSGELTGVEACAV